MEPFTYPLFREPQHQRLETTRVRMDTYYSTPQWKARARDRKSQDHHRCQDCGHANRPLFAHHVDRTRTGFEMNSDLISLCETCHQRREGIYA